MEVNDRIEKVKTWGLCMNCLKSSHFSAQCTASKCKKCKRAHNTLLHLKPKTQLPEPKAEPDKLVLVETGPKQKTISSDQVLLSTALILVEDVNKQWHQCRALLDNGAMSNFVTSSLCTKLGLPTTHVTGSIRGVGDTPQAVQARADVHFKSLHNGSTSYSTSCLVIDKITCKLPICPSELKTVQVPPSLQLADPDFQEAQEIDVLLGSAVYWELEEGGRVKIPNMGLTFRQTKLGWIVGGAVSKSKRVRTHQHDTNCLATLDESLDTQVRQFWEIEEVETDRTLTPDDQYCEDLFKNTHTKNKDGYFVVRIPFKDNVTHLGDSRHNVQKRLHRLETKLTKNDKLRTEYHKIIQEYIDMGHLKDVQQEYAHDTDSKPTYYIPHQAVIRDDSLTTKLRVVFDASMRTDSGLSLNDVQHIGPPIQNDIFTILINFRAYEYALSGDISKMYRMIWLHDDHKRLHRILWRENSAHPIRCYELQTLTFGTASAPFLAMRCLRQVAIEHESLHPTAARVIKNNFYVDDLVYGTQTIPELIQLQHQIFDILHSAGFVLRKWRCNDPSVYRLLKVDSGLEHNTVQDTDDITRLLGLVWHPHRDELGYPELMLTPGTTGTKRVVLSELSKLYDPFGLMGPIVITGKLLMQRLWQKHVSWDDPLSEEHSRQWALFRAEMALVHTIVVRRKVLLNGYSLVELHGFCDASERAYGAAVFLRSQDAHGKTQVSLLCAKSRVAPLKTITIPRLELCGALLLARLMNRISTQAQFPIHKLHYWTDSTITLAWIRSTPGRWKTFVANRVSEIQKLTETSDWRHVPTKDNPTDILSRGTGVQDLKHNTLWWTGPPWLANEAYPTDTKTPAQETIPEQRTIACSTAVVPSTDLINRYSSYGWLIRVTARCLRFGRNCRTPTEHRRRGELTAEDLQNASMALVRISQIQSFTLEYECLQAHAPISNSSKLLSLNPFLDEHGIMRVGGRLQQCGEPYETKHPAILDPKHQFTTLLATHLHQEKFHCGPTSLLSFVRQRYWPLAGRRLVKQVVRKCIVCIRARPATLSYIMGQLPKERVKPAFPFETVGVDYAGPILVKDRKTRNHKVITAYICVFVCFTTKAIHLELVTDMTSDCFLACLNRFISRRGTPRHMFSDNGKNFVGANSALQQLRGLVRENSSVHQFLAREGIRWHFIPPRTPSFGGIWEAAVKAVKYHLVRSLKTRTLPYEDMSTLLSQIESVLNSRPLCPISSDPNDNTPLTPSHFLIGRHACAPTQPHPFNVHPTSRRNQYEVCRTILRQFWTRWKQEYLAQLQTRNKWRTNPSQSPALQVGKLVIIKDDQNQPYHWPMGRIVDLHPGPAGMTRVVSVKVKDNILKRGVQKICVLPDD